MVAIDEDNVAEDGQLLLFSVTSEEPGLRFISFLVFLLLRMRVTRMVSRDSLTRCHKKSRRKKT